MFVEKMGDCTFDVFPIIQVLDAVIFREGTLKFLAKNVVGFLADP